MLIIVEGCDLAGKTTLVTELADNINDSRFDMKVEVYHRGPPTGSMLEEYHRPLLANYTPRLLDRHVICDRWHVGELIYGPVLRGKSELDFHTWLAIELLLKGLGAVMVYVDPGWATIEQRFYDEGDDLVLSLNQLNKIHESYRDYFLVHPPDIVADTKTDIFDIIRLAEER